MPKVFRPKNARTKKHRGFRIKTSQRKQRTRKQRTRSQLKKNNSRLLSRKRIMRGGEIPNMKYVRIDIKKNDYADKDRSRPNVTEKVNRKVDDYKQKIMENINTLNNIGFYAQNKEKGRTLKLRDFCGEIVSEGIQEPEGSMMNNEQHSFTPYIHETVFYKNNPRPWIESEINAFFARIKFDLILEGTSTYPNMFTNPVTHFISYNLCENTKQPLDNPDVTPNVTPDVTSVDE